MMKNYEKAKCNSGITLVALVITIIILLILAGITINLTLGENGILKRSEGAKEEYTKSDIKEELEMDISEMYIVKKGKGETLTKQDIADKLGNKAVILEVTDSQIDGEYKEYGFIVDENNKVIIGEKLTGVKPTGKAELITTEVGIVEAKIKVTGQHEEGIAEIRATNGAQMDEDKGTEGIIFKVTENKTYNFVIKANNGRNAIVSCKVTNLIEEERDIFTAIEETKTSSKKKIKVVGSQNTEIYGLNIIQIDGNLELGENLLVNGETKEIAGITKTDNEYSVGEQADVAQGTGYAQNTVVLKVDGNLKIDENITLTAVKSSANLGGPKGLIIYCTGELTNNGTINMTARGAKAEGQNLYLYKNKDNSFEYIPKDGCEGGASVVGVSATTGSRMSGGGGGAGRAKSSSEPIGYGAMGTSYSGGSGSGAKNSWSGSDGGKFGGPGGEPGRHTSMSGTFGRGGGAGNPGALSQRSTSITNSDIISHGANGTRRVSCCFLWYFKQIGKYSFKRFEWRKYKILPIWRAELLGVVALVLE